VTRGRRFAAAALAAVAACATTPDAPPEGRLGAAAAAVEDPIAALGEGVERLGRLADDSARAAARGDDAARAAAEAAAESEARALVELLAHPAFDARPRERGRLRVELLFVARPPAPEERAAALRRCRELAAALR